MPINWLTVGSLYGAAGVAFGAFGAHGLKSRGISDAKIGSWSTAAHYQVSSSQTENDENDKREWEEKKRGGGHLASPRIKIRNITARNNIHPQHNSQIIKPRKSYCNP